MGLEFTGIERGVILDNEAVIIPLVGTPGGGDSDVVGMGSLGLSDNGLTYHKITAGTGAAAWEVFGAGAGGVASSWREPVRFAYPNATLDLSVAESALNAGLMNGGAVDDQDRILITGLVTGNKNVYIVNGTPGAGATLVEDTNAATVNDIVRVDGTDDVFYFDGANWVEPDAAVLTELANIRAFIGKTAGGPTLPQYTSNQVVADNDSLVEAVSKLDAVAVLPAESLAVVGGTTETLETSLVDEFLSITWMVYVQEVGTQKTRLIEVTAAHNGSATADATVVKHTEKRIRMGSIAGLDINVVLAGAGAAQAMELTAVAANVCDFRIVRIGSVKA